LKSRLYHPQSATAKAADSFRYVFLIGGLLIGAVAGFLLGRTRRRPVPANAPAPPSPYVQVGPTDSQAIHGSFVGGQDGGVVTPSNSAPVVTAHGGDPTAVNVLAHRVKAPRGTGLVVAAADPVGFAEFDDGITRRIASMDGVPLAPGAQVRDGAVPKGRQARVRK
jgi:hypothetical protein